MGSYSECCLVTRLPIHSGEPVLLVAVRALSYQSDGTSHFAKELWDYNRDWLGVRKTAAKAEKTLAALNIPGVDPKILDLYREDIDRAKEDVPPYLIAAFGSYDDYGGIESAVDAASGKEVKVPSLTDLTSCEYYFFVKKPVFEKIVHFTRSFKLKGDVVEYGVENWSPVTRFDEDLGHFANFCRMAYIQLKDPDHLMLGSQYLEPLTVTYAELLTRLSRLELRRMLAEEMQKDSDWNRDRFRHVRVPLTIREE